MSELETFKPWHTTWGIDACDKRTYLVSGAVTLWVANTNSGKTTAAMQVAAYNAIDNKIPTDLYLTHTSQFEAKLGIMVNRGLLSSWQADEIRNNEEYRTPKWMDYVRDLWDKNITGAPLRIHEIREMRIDDALHLIEIGQRRLKIVDDVRGMVMQGIVFPDSMSLAQKTDNIFSSLASTAKTGDNVVLVFNQFGEGQIPTNVWTARSASFGGASGLNIARTIINVLRPEIEVQDNIVYLDAVFTKTEESAISVENPRTGKSSTNNPDNELFKMYINLDHRYITGEID